MAGATPEPDDFVANLAREIRSIKQRLERVEAPTAGQTLSLQDALTDLNPTTLTVDGNAVVSGSSTLSGPLYAANANNSPVTSSPVALYIDTSDRIGRMSSTAESKQDVQSMQVDEAAVMQAVVRVWKWVTDSEAGWQFGLIAEELEAAGLGRWVYHDPDGSPAGVHYERFVLALLPVVQGLVRARDGAKAERDELKSKVADLATRLAAVEARTVSVSVKKEGTL